MAGWVLPLTRYTLHPDYSKAGSLVSVLQVGLWRLAGDWRGWERAPYSTLVPSDGKLSQQLFPLPVSVYKIFVF